MQLEVSEFRCGKDAIIRLAGELDIATGSQVIDATRRALRDQPGRLLVDLEAVDFVDLTGIRALIHCRRMAVAKHSELALQRPSVATLHLLELTGLRAVFSVDA